LPPVRLSTLLDRGEVEVVDGVTRKEIEDNDKLALQSYGRPYDDHGKPSGRYYAHTKPSPLPVLPSASNWSLTAAARSALCM
jgi:hypothetical protein